MHNLKPIFLDRTKCQHRKKRCRRARSEDKGIYYFGRLCYPRPQPCNVHHSWMEWYDRKMD